MLTLSYPIESQVRSLMPYWFKEMPRKEATEHVDPFLSYRITGSVAHAVFVQRDATQGGHRAC